MKKELLHSEKSLKIKTVSDFMHMQKVTAEYLKPLTQTQLGFSLKVVPDMDENGCNGNRINLIEFIAEFLLCLHHLTVLFPLCGVGTACLSLLFYFISRIFLIIVIIYRTLSHQVWSAQHVTILNPHSVPVTATIL